MGILSNKGTFIAALVAIVGFSIGSLAYSQTVSFGAETDVPPPVTGSSGPDVYGGGIPDAGGFPAPGGGVPGLPPAAPIDSGSDDSGDGPSPSSAGGVGTDVNALPSTGSGGYLEPKSNNLAFALVALAAAVAVTGSLALAKSRR